MLPPHFPPPVMQPVAVAYGLGLIFFIIYTLTKFIRAIVIEVKKSKHE